MVNIVSHFSPWYITFFKTFFKSFCRGEKVVQHNVKFSLGTHKMAERQLRQWKKSTYFLSDHRQYFTKKISLVDWKIKCKYIILFSFLRSIFWYITLKILLIFCCSKQLSFILMIFDGIRQIISWVLDSKIRLTFHQLNQMR